MIILKLLSAKTSKRSRASIFLYLDIESKEYEVRRSDWCREGLDVENVQATTRKEESLLSRLEISDVNTPHIMRAILPLLDQVQRASGAQPRSLQFSGLLYIERDEPEHCLRGW